MRLRTFSRGAALIHPHISPLENPSHFIVYSFRKDEVSKGSPVWQMEESCTEEDTAIGFAESIFKNRDVTRVEVRKRALSDAGMWEDQTVHMLGSKPRRIRDVVLMMCAAFTCIAAAGFIALYK
jgi:hypothetical protein